MPQTCTICKHPKLSEINAALVSCTEPFRVLAVRYGTSAATLQRHQKAHLPVLLAKAEEAAEMVRADNLMGSLRDLYTRAFDILQKAEKAGALETALKAIRELRGILELLAKLSGELEPTAPGNTRIEIIYIDQTIGRSMSDGSAPQLIEAPNGGKSYLNASVSDAPVSIDNK
jgi:hypothetical protein